MRFKAAEILPFSAGVCSTNEEEKRREKEREIGSGFRETDLMARANGSSTFLAERARFSLPVFYSTGVAANGSLENRAQKCFPVGD